jgi:hypothetical protein
MSRTTPRRVKLDVARAHAALLTGLADLQAEIHPHTYHVRRQGLLIWIDQATTTGLAQEADRIVTTGQRDGGSAGFVHRVAHRLMPRSVHITKPQRKR